MVSELRLPREWHAVSKDGHAVDAGELAHAAWRGRQCGNAAEQHHDGAKTRRQARRRACMHDEHTKSEEDECRARDGRRHQLGPCAERQNAQPKTGKRERNYCHKRCAIPAQMGTYGLRPVP